MVIEDEFYIKLKQKLIDNAPSEEEYAQFTKEERDRYQLGLKYDRDLLNSYETAYNEGYKHGINLATAKMLLEKNIDIKTIIEITGLSVKQIEKLK